MERTEQKFLKFIDENELICQGEKILVGFSGGPDSVFMLHLLIKFSRRLKIELTAFHIHHGLRGKDADEDENFCRDFCYNRKIKYDSVKKRVKSFAHRNRFSLEEAGRIIRYNEFKRILKKKKLDKIATAHNANDNTETVLLNLIKGTGLDGISGIPVKRENIIRPILCFTREEISTYLDKNIIPFRIDRSNEETDFERNFLRNKVMPLIKERLNPSIDSAVLVSSENFRNVRDYILESESEAFRNISRNKEGNILIPVSDLKNTRESLKGLLLKTMLERELNTPLFSVDIRKIFSLTDAQTGRKVELSGGIVVFKERHYLKLLNRLNYTDNFNVNLHIGEKKTTPAGKISIQRCNRDTMVYSNNKNKEYIAADSLSTEFTIRRWKPGDSFRPLGMKGSKKVSDFLNEQKVESSGKKNHLILLNKNKVVWIIGLRIDDRFKVTSSTQKILELCLN